jgi:hypothetical protein
VACSSAGHDVAAGDDALDAIAVQRSDLPSGWRPLDQVPAGGELEEFLACGRGPDTADHVEQRTLNGFQNNPRSTQIVAVAGVVERLASPDDVRADVDMLTSRTILGCYRAVIQQQLPRSLRPGTRVASVTFTNRPLRGLPGNVVAFLAGRASIASRGQRSLAFFDVAHVTGSSIEAHLAFSAYGQRIDEQLERAAIRGVARRAADA